MYPPNIDFEVASLLASNVRFLAHELPAGVLIFTNKCSLFVILKEPTLNLPTWNVLLPVNVLFPDFVAGSDKLYLSQIS